jgi:hypothetical protein
MNLFLLGAIAMASVVIGLFFLRSWRNTGDRFFLFFSASFILEGFNRAALAMTIDPNEDRPLFYFVRFLSFVLILIAVGDKNRKKTSTGNTRR